MYEATSGQVAAVILFALAACVLAHWCQKREDGRAMLSVTSRAKSLFAWQFTSMFQAVWTARRSNGHGGLRNQDLTFIRQEARNIRGRVGVGEVIDPTPAGEALLVRETIQWCAAILDTGEGR